MTHSGTGNQRFSVSCLYKYNNGSKNMPTYEYFCDNCNYEFELFQSIKAESFSNCPKCNKILERKVSLPGGLVFKGSGFYITDYKKNGNGGGSSSSKSTSKSGEPKTTSESTEKTETNKTETIKTETTKTESTAKNIKTSETKTVTT
jgi:putative FmdB family regulatory protein